MRVGFPIRRSSDQSLFAAPQGLSQRTTSFIASQRQGIHQIPLLHLITLIIDANTLIRTCSHRWIIRKTSYIHEFRSTIPSSHDDTHRCPSPCGDRAGDRTNLLFTMSNQHAVRGRRPSKAKLFYGRAGNQPRPTFTRNGGARRDRTDDLMLAKHALSQLSYGPHASHGRTRKWWARKDLNFRPHAYQARALTS